MNRDEHMKEVYKARKLRDGLWSIAEQHSSDGMMVMMYLVEGAKKAALIDCGFGVTDTLRTFVESLTAKPLACYIAHGHPDHAGAAALFDEIYMSEKDASLLPISLSFERRMGDVFGHGGNSEHEAYCREHIVMCDKLPYKDIGHGTVIDLGEKRLEVFAIPGHTQGSLAFYNREENYALTSDAFSNRTALVTLPKEKRIGIEAYRDGLDRFLAAINDETLLYWGHGTEPLPHSVPKDMLSACQEVLEGKTEKDTLCDNPFSRRLSAAGKRMMEHICGSVMLVYDANTL